MALRLKDFRCASCGRMDEILVIVGDPLPKHCDVEMTPMPGAPRVSIVDEHYNANLGQVIRSKRHLDREMNKAGSYVPTNNDLARAMDNPTIIDQNKAERRKEAMKAKTEKTWSDLHNEHKVDEFPSS
jgi:hypothetical protein